MIAYDIVDKNFLIEDLTLQEKQNYIETYLFNHNKTNPIFILYKSYSNVNGKLLSQGDLSGIIFPFKKFYGIVTKSEKYANYLKQNGFTLLYKNTTYLSEA